MAVTMQDVARAAGVSVKTVSNVVNGYPYIRDTTKEKVLSAIADLGYQMNATARSLRSGKTGMIGLAVPELSLPYFAQLADAVIQHAEARGLTVLIEQTGADPAREREALHGHRRQLTDGLIMSPLALGPDDVDTFTVRYPLVLLGERVFNANADHVTMHNVEGARAATSHLITQGCQRIAVIGAHEGEVMGSAKLRTEGYLQALADHGIDADPTLIREAGLWHRSTGAQALFQLLDDGVEFDGIFALNDAMALGALYALHTRRVAVPDQVKVIGFDDIDDARYSFPPLSSVDPGRDHIARTAVDLLHERIEQPTDDHTPQKIIADYTIIARASSGGDGTTLVTA
ncbi:LacI family DNA-binding transcriptional regulator [Jonesia denitrificans]|nr:LacI family DNA-binding transcriptional regulator [Jonesia denitrificans]ASE08154.2 LacI family transcriptional regulator [Jonesia denitrificans]QXB42757.1 LacI family transcriptional regulator [Jonesia denitrificans]